MTAAELENGYWRAYRNVYHWPNIFKGAWVKTNERDRIHPLLYSGTWKKMEPLWDLLIRTKQGNQILPALEDLLCSFNTAILKPQTSLKDKPDLCLPQLNC